MNKKLILFIGIIGLLFVSGCKIVEQSNKIKCEQSGGKWSYGQINLADDQRGFCICEGIGKISNRYECIPLSDVGFVCCNIIIKGNSLGYESTIANKCNSPSIIVENDLC